MSGPNSAHGDCVSVREPSSVNYSECSFIVLVLSECSQSLSSFIANVSAPVVDASTGYGRVQYFSLFELFTWKLAPENCSVVHNIAALARLVARALCAAQTLLKLFRTRTYSILHANNLCDAGVFAVCLCAL